MRVLVLTPINPVLAGDVYSKVSRYMLDNEKSINFLCFPFFAEMKTTQEEGQYIPNLFAMLQTSLTPEIQNKLYNTHKNTVVIGNTYKEQKFDTVVSFGYEEDEIFDNYLEMISNEGNFKTFAEKAKVHDLYKPEDAELNFPTVDHLILFLEGVYDNGNKTKRKAKESS